MPGVDHLEGRELLDSGAHDGREIAQGLGASRRSESRPGALSDDGARDSVIHLLA